MPESIAVGSFRYNGGSQGTFTIRNVFADGGWGGVALDFKDEAGEEIARIAKVAEGALTAESAEHQGQVAVYIMDTRYLMIRGEGWVTQPYEVSREDVGRIEARVKPAIEGFRVESLDIFAIPSF